MMPLESAQMSSAWSPSPYRPARADPCGGPAHPSCKRHAVCGGERLAARGEHHIPSEPPLSTLPRRSPHEKKKKRRSRSRTKSKAESRATSPSKQAPRRHSAHSASVSPVESRGSSQERSRYPRRARSPHPAPRPRAAVSEQRGEAPRPPLGQHRLAPALGAPQVRAQQGWGPPLVASTQSLPRSLASGAGTGGPVTGPSSPPHFALPAQAGPPLSNGRRALSGAAALGSGGRWSRSHSLLLVTFGNVSKPLISLFVLGEFLRKKRVRSLRRLFLLCRAK